MIFGPRFVTVRNSIKCKYLIVRLNTMVTHGLMRLSCFFCRLYRTGSYLTAAWKKSKMGANSFSLKSKIFRPYLGVKKISKVQILHAGSPAYNPASVFRQDSQKPVIFRNFTIFETDFLILHQNNGLKGVFPVFFFIAGFCRIGFFRRQLRMQDWELAYFSKMPPSLKPALYLVVQSVGNSQCINKRKQQATIHNPQQTTPQHHNHYELSWNLFLLSL